MAFGLSHKEGNIALLRLNHLGGQLFSLSCLGDSLLPFISEQNYNDNIKAAFTVAGITRLVTELDPVTRKE